MTIMEMIQGNISLKISELVRCGDVYLCHWDCPICKQANFSCYFPNCCEFCNQDFSLVSVDLLSWRVLAGSVRKPRSGLSKKSILALLKMQENSCAYCSVDISEGYEVEHIVPFAAGGSNNPANLVLSCGPCNKLASGHYFKSFNAKQNYIFTKRALAKK